MSSSYERIIANILKQNNVRFKREVSFPDLKGFKGRLFFDFVIFNDKNQIEYFLECNGEQHYQANAKMGGERAFAKRREYDRRKINYSLIKKIPLICIPYWDINSNLTYEDILIREAYVAKTIWHNDHIMQRGGLL